MTSAELEAGFVGENPIRRTCELWKLEQQRYALYTSLENYGMLYEVRTTFKPNAAAKNRTETLETPKAYIKSQRLAYGQNHAHEEKHLANRASKNQMAA